MIGKLKLRCGAQFTSKMEGMINDIRDEVHEKGFSSFCKDNHITNGGCEFTVQALTSGFWPSTKADDVKLPPSMNECLSSFEAYYGTQTNNRKLVWVHKMGVVTIQGNFKKRKCDLVVSAVQAAIMMLFNDTAELSIDAITKLTGMDPEVIKAQLRSLASGQFKILNKQPVEGYKTVHVMSVNKDFSHAQRRVRIPNAVSKTTKTERGAATVAVQEDRRHAIEANIVRVMKARKELEHTQLVSEVSQHLFQYFKPDPREIKRRIEDLITREYLMRDEERSSVYHYLA
jgi:cullin 1